MYAFYSLLVYIFYTLFRKEPSQGDGQLLEPEPPQSRDAAPAEPARRLQGSRPPCEDLWPELTDLDSSSESSSAEEEEEEDGDSPDGAATSPLTEFLALKQGMGGGQLGPLGKEAPGGQAPESPLLAVLSHLLSFLEHYGHLQRLQEQAGAYRARLRRAESRRRQQLRSLRRASRQREQDALSLIASLEGVISEQQSTLETLRGGTKVPSACPPPPAPPASLHQLVESISALQGERARLAEEIRGLRQELDEREKDKQQLAGSFHLQIQELKQQIEEREDELARLRTGMGVTDSEKRIHNLTVENEGLKQSLGVTQGLLQQLAAVSAQPSALLAKENEDLRGQVQRLEASLQQKLAQLAQLEGQVDALQWHKEEEAQQLDERLCALQQALDAQLSRAPDVQYVTQMVEVESPSTLRSLAEAEERNRVLQEQLSSQGERCQRLTEQLQGSEEVAAGLQHKILAYEREMAQLREQLLREISHLEAQKEEAVKEASECSEQHLDQLRQQFAGVRQRLAVLQPLLRSIRTNYGSLRSQVCSFSDFYEAALKEARQQMCSAISEVSEANQDLREKYQHEVLLRRKYHDQLVELKGNIRVLCRLKPVTGAEQQAGEARVAVSTEPGSESSVTTSYKGKERTFELDKVFLPQATQEEVFLEMEPLVLSCLNGYNVCIFAYGQTGSGKTYTMEGVPSDPGINQRALEALYREMEAKQGLCKYAVSLSLVEIYNEVIRDLLGKDPQERLDIKLNPDGSGQLHVPGLTCVEVQGIREIKKMLALGKRNRATHCTNMNERSSRSHALLTVTITGTDLSTGTKTSGTTELPCTRHPEPRRIRGAAKGAREGWRCPVAWSFTGQPRTLPRARSRPPRCPGREAEPGGPGGLGARVEVGGAGRAAEGGAEHQQVPAGAGRGDPGAARQAAPRAFPQLQAHLPAAGLAGPWQQDRHDGADLTSAEGRGRDRLLPQVCPARLQGGAGPGCPPCRPLGPWRGLSPAAMKPSGALLLPPCHPQPPDRADPGAVGQVAPAASRPSELQGRGC